MKNFIDIQQPEQPSEDDKTFVSQQFRAFNDQQSGIFPEKDINLFVYGPNRQVIAGLFGDISWGWLHVATLWVAESHRNSGIGTALLDKAESEAILMGVYQVYLETTDFQAVGFYKNLGYEVFGQLENQPPGHVCFYMKKIIVKDHQR